MQRGRKCAHFLGALHTLDTLPPEREIRDVGRVDDGRTTGTLAAGRNAPPGPLKLSSVRKFRFLRRRDEAGRYLDHLICEISHMLPSAFHLVSFEYTIPKNPEESSLVSSPFMILGDSWETAIKFSRTFMPNDSVRFSTRC